MGAATAGQLPDELHERICSWSYAWSLPELPAEVDVQVSGRFRASLGRCYPARGVVRIARFLLDGPPSLLAETLCHELAHLAAHQLHGGRVAPHGAEWRALMRAAGYDPRARVPERELHGIARPAPRRRVLWEHRCPGCGAHRVAGRPVPEWRCRRCAALGRHGPLAIRRLGP